jgi:3' exoribonuclease, RNase T-like
MAYVMVDIESDGPIPGDYSMLSIGAVLVNEKLDSTFYRELRPISDKHLPGALAASGLTREKTLEFGDPARAMEDFAVWLKEVCRNKPVFISDNNGFDWMFVCWYFHHFTNSNPFGHSSYNLGSLYKGLIKDTYKDFKHLRVTPHTHNPVDDAKGNAEALLQLKTNYGLKINW